MSKFTLFETNYTPAEVLGRTRAAEPRRPPATPQFVGVLALWALFIFAAGLLILAR